MERSKERLEQIEQIVVNAEQMRAIEARLFDAGMPVAALMEKVGGAIADRIHSLYPSGIRIGVLVGPGHNGGDALVVARELYFRGYEILIYRPFAKLKELTGQHAQYVASLGIPFYEEIEPLQNCDLLIDGLFGFGLERSLADPVAGAVDELNRWSKPLVSIDLPSGLHTDTGEVLGTAVRATGTFCLGLWKLGLLQDNALKYIGTAELIDFDIPLADIWAGIGPPPTVRRVTKSVAIAHLPLKRPPATHKYKMGHLLLICGSRRYTGAALLSALGARASGVGMLSIAVPDSLKPLLSMQLPEALIIGCPETDTGAIEKLPLAIDVNSYSAIACGPGITLDAAPMVETVLESDRPLVLDADGLNVLAHLGTIPTVSERRSLTILTPHEGEFKRLFPEQGNKLANRAIAAREAAVVSRGVVVLKGAIAAIAHPNGDVWLNPESTPALARGGSGDVLTGLMGGLVAQAAAREQPVEPLVQTAVWWHARAGILAAQERTELGVDAFTLTQYLTAVLRSQV